MSITLIIRKIESFDGNYCRSNNDIYISSKNMWCFLEMIEKQEQMLNMLITPYLIIEDSNFVYELHYYEFELEIINIQKSYFVEHFQGNTLPEEIVKNIKSKGVVAEGDKAFYLKALQQYLIEMEKMEFKYDKEHDKKLEKASLYFQIF